MQVECQEQMMNLRLQYRTVVCQDDELDTAGQ